MNFFLFEKLSNLLKVAITFCDLEGNILYTSKSGTNPIKNHTGVRSRLIRMSQSKELPYIYRDDFLVCYGMIRYQDKVCILGPIATKKMTTVDRHKYYQKFDGMQFEEVMISSMNEGDILNLVSIVAKLFSNQEYDDEQLLAANQELFGVKDTSKADREQFTFDSEEEDIYRHTYQDERLLLEMVKAGNVKAALERTRNMDGDIGKLSKNDLEHWKNLLVVASTLCARAAIEAGVEPYIAYRVSGFYINKGSSSDDVFKVITYRNQAVEELTQLVRNHNNQRHTSSYTMQCKDYIKKHYREKIYLENISSSLGISDSYLSRLFKQETGIRLQDYIVQIRLERAANLLVYSNEPISRIAEYVNFSSQSHFGKQFKEKFGFTPRVYRERNKPTEFID
nr:AraC family transcriptional regulator [Lachnospiraceae bacterium]